MNEQLTLDGLGEAKQANKTAPAKTKTKNQIIDEDIQTRIQRLLDQKSEKYLQTTESLPESLPETSVAVVEEKVQREIAEIAKPLLQPEPDVLSVTDLNKNIKQLLEKTFPFLWVKGEISNFKIPGSGHLYFTLKDSGAQIKAVMFRGFAQALKFKPEDGMEVLVRCRVTVYEPRGDYQLFCEVMEPVGFGALQVAFEKLKGQLQKEGLFDVARKKQIPNYPERIVIVTSPTGAAIKDMLNVLGRRAGGNLDITIIPTSVQGDKAPGEIARAVRLISQMGTKRFDVAIVGRGGGSLEDLWAFNTEEVVRAVAECSIPTISAVGHEVDFTICDFVADLRAPTPSAAAELVVKNKSDLCDRISLLNRQLGQLILKKVHLAQNSTHLMSKRLIDPKRRLQDLMLRCDEWSERLVGSMDRYLGDSQLQVKFLIEKLGSPESTLQVFAQKIEMASEQIRAAMASKLQASQNGFAQAVAMLNSLSPLNVLERGYSIVKSQEKIIKEKDQVKAGDKLSIRLSKGEIEAEVL